MLPELDGKAWRRWLAKPLVAQLHQLLATRFQARDLRAKSMAACRVWYLTLGQTWAEQDWLAQPEDIFWLTLEEIERTLMIGQGIAAALPSTVEGRKATYQIYAKTPMPLTLKESQLPAIQLGLEQADLSLDVIVGMPICPGQARGTVIVLHTPQDFQPTAGAADENPILVMPSTGPMWLPLLHQAAGLIVETGGLLSHGSVIAREYGLPAVANIPHATRQFRTGDRVLVDGSTGVVQLLEKSNKS
jgi:pyruvate,water dikinase